MNCLEKRIYDLVKANPKIKLKIRNIYQSLFDMIPDRDNYAANRIAEKNGYFFGFHDITPFSYDEKYILSNKLTIPLRMPLPEDALIVGFWDKGLKKYTGVSKTYAWNYHKGCRLQWLGRRSHSFIFNNRKDGRLISNIYSIDTKKMIEVDYAIDTVSPNGNFATSFSYERLNKYMPGYGYDCNDGACFEDDTSGKTGLFLVNLKNNERKLIVSLKKLSKIAPDGTMVGAHHFVTHSEFSPDGDRISFLHRWTFNDPNKRYSRLVTCKLDGSDIHISGTTGMVSHYVWDKNNGILAYCQINHIDGHYVFSDYTMKNVRRVAKELNSDGHQSYIPNTGLFVTDTYPDRRRYAKLYLCDIENDEVKKIADLKSYKKYQSPNHYKHWACDLHPRVSPLGNYVCFDSVHTGERALCLMKINNIYKK